MMPLPIVIVLLALGFVALNLLTSRVRGDVEHWQRLADRYAATTRPTGQLLIGQVQNFGVEGGFSELTRLLICPEGLYLYPHPLDRPGRQPLLVPWSDVEIGSERVLLWYRTFALTLGGTERLRVTRTAWEAMIPFLVR